MISTLRQKPASLFLLLGVYFIVQVLVRLALPASLELDEGQQLYYAQWLSIGYDSQPPFYNWIQYGVVELLGSNRLALALLKNLMLFASYALIALAAAQVLKSRDLIIIACLSLLTMPQISFEAQRDLTHTVALIFCTALLLFGILRTLKSPSLWSYALTGAAIGCGFISKYNFVLLVSAAFLAILAEPKFRRRLLDWHILLTAAVALAIVLPHALWFFQHMQEATRNTLGKMTDDNITSLPQQMFKGLTSLSTAVLASAAPTMALLLIPFARTLPFPHLPRPAASVLSASNEWTRLLGRMMLLVVAVLALMVIFGGVSAIKDRWLAPCFLMLPLYLCLKVEAAGLGEDGQLRRFLVVALTIMVLVPVILYGRVVGAGIIGHYQKQNVPYGQAVSTALASAPNRPVLVLTSDQQMAGNIRLHAPDIAVTVPPTSGVPVPARFDAQHPLLVIWRNFGRPNPDMPKAMKDWIATYPGLQAQSVGEIALPFLHGRPHSLYSFGYALYYSTTP
ncbi:glycosyl transferase [Agrobacterium vitis]|uniref:glycosyltransferase family 39 protein n=1 Tax=Agrobacterium vitis TaxID=373 RepID=UPI0015D9BC37|nr:glycosyltransferase family 39 protein [Agrobacterium vitis]BCH65452.1 glycosyl transferase [Agrobacterium vitis]